MTIATGSSDRPRHRPDPANRAEPVSGGDARRPTRLGVYWLRSPAIVMRGWWPRWIAHARLRVRRWLSTMVTDPVERVRQWENRANAREFRLHLDDRALRDIGLTRQDALRRPIRRR